MHILGLILTIIMGAAVWYWRLKMLRSAASEALDLAQTLANLPRKMRFQKATKNSKIAQIDDPRYGVATLLYFLTVSDGALKESEENLIRSQLQEQFNPSEEELSEIEVFGRWAAGELAGRASAPRDLVKQIHKLAPAAGNELLSMVKSVEKDSHADVYGRAYRCIQKEFMIDE